MSELRIPRSVQDAVQRRVEKLSEAARRVLTLAAVMGRRFDFALLQQIKELIAAQLVVEASAEQFAFGHALTQPAIYAQLLARERQALHRTMAQTIERVYAESLDAHVEDLARHFMESGDLSKGLSYALRAAEKAERLFAHDEALSHYAHARQCAERLNQPEQLAAIEAGIGEVYALRGPFNLAVESYERALALMPSIEKRAASKLKIGEIYVRVGDERGVPFTRTDCRVGGGERFSQSVR